MQADHESGSVISGNKSIIYRTSNQEIGRNGEMAVNDSKFGYNGKFSTHLQKAGNFRN